MHSLPSSTYWRDSSTSLQQRHSRSVSIDLHFPQRHHSSTAVIFLPLRTNSSSDTTVGLGIVPIKRSLTKCWNMLKPLLLILVDDNQYSSKAELQKEKFGICKQFFFTEAEMCNNHRIYVTMTVCMCLSYCTRVNTHNAIDGKNWFSPKNIFLNTEFAVEILFSLHWNRCLMNQNRITEILV